MDNEANEAHDVIVVGSGAVGGWVAKDLTEAGLRVLVLEAGPALDARRDLRAPPRGPWLRERQNVQRQFMLCNEETWPFYVDDLDNPYTTPADKPFLWLRGRQVGGRTLTWARAAYRMSDLELGAASRDGIGIDWPFRTADLAPYYERVEDFVGIFGRNDGLATLPDSSLLREEELTWIDQQLVDAVAGLGVGARAVKARFVGELRPRGDSKCPYCGKSARDCPPFPTATSTGSTLHAARETGRLTVRADAVVSHVLASAGGDRAEGVAYVDRRDRTAHEVRARVVVLCASTIESVRILLQSGIANSSGLVGRYLMDHCLAKVDGLLPLWGDRVGDMDTPARSGIYIPRFRNVDEPHEAFRRGYGTQVYCFPMSESSVLIALRGFGEVLPHPDNRVTLDPELKDAWGLPVAHIDYAYRDNERAMVADAMQRLRDLAAAAGLTVVLAEPAPPGGSIHEVGGARMGTDPKTSVVNPWAQSWDVPNLFVPDGACYPSAGCQNPTLTMMAIAARASDRIVELLGGALTR